MTEQAEIPGIPGARLWADRDLGAFVELVMDDNRREMEALARAGISKDELPPAHMLAISGGGDAGAFAAGILNGWTQHGSRPSFRVVTGVSAGALAAPFAYLGPRYDGALHDMATSVGPKDIFRTRNVIAGFLSDGLADSAPLYSLISRHVTRELLDAVAEEHAKGRVLMIGTTELDSGRPVTWNMGRIASSGSPGALTLFRKVMVASMSIPGAVSPVMIDVEVDGQPHQEMHVDGAVINQIFLYPARGLAEFKKAVGQPITRKMHAYVLRNGKLGPEWAWTRRRMSSIFARSISTLLNVQGSSDLERIHDIVTADGVDFNCAYIGNDFTFTHAVRFESGFLRRLYQYGYEQAATGIAWKKAVPSRVE
ncbi:MAG TPA: patatin-like phospholipase family protein [Gammaproteobacteria bacterium]|jgi:predicted acylesterase/phospholipase RssA